LKLGVVKMEIIFRIPFSVLAIPHLKIRKPTWLVQPSPIVVFALTLFSYFLVTAGNLLCSIIRASNTWPHVFSPKSSIVNIDMMNFNVHIIYFIQE